MKIGVLRGFFPNDFAVYDFAKMKRRETRVQRRELLPLLTITFTLPCHTGVAQRVGGLDIPETLQRK